MNRNETKWVNEHAADGEQTLKLGDRVKILKGMREFVGRAGTIIDQEEDGSTTLYRVELDRPVKVKGLPGVVGDDLWAADFLQVLS